MQFDATLQAHAPIQSPVPAYERREDETSRTILKAAVEGCSANINAVAHNLLSLSQVFIPVLLLVPSENHARKNAVYLWLLRTCYLAM